MTTIYELPPEPTDGTRVRDNAGRVWTLSHAGWQNPDHATTGFTWSSLMAYFSPLTLIEPDPWPTAPLIVADRGGRVNRRGLFVKYARDADYIDIAAAVGNEEFDVLWAEDGGDTLTNVVPVRVVPVAEWEAMKSDHRTRSHLVDGCHICALIAATDALGVQK